MLESATLQAILLMSSRIARNLPYGRKRTPQYKTGLQLFSTAQDPRCAVMHRFPKEERIIEVLSFKMLLNDAINNLRDFNTSVVYGRQHIEMR